jgi:uncharacterized Zn-finger protein
MLQRKGRKQELSHIIFFSLESVFNMSRTNILKKRSSSLFSSFLVRLSPLTFIGRELLHFSLCSRIVSLNQSKLKLPNEKC